MLRFYPRHAQGGKTATLPPRFFLFRHYYNG